MKTAIDYQKYIFYHLQGLSVEKLREISHFILFLKTQDFTAKKEEEMNYISLNQELNEMNRNEMLHLEAELNNYQNLYPLEEVCN